MSDLPRYLYYARSNGVVIGYQVSFRAQGEKLTKYFGFNKFGGEEGAYKEAYSFLEEACEKYGIEIKERKEESEYPGVSRTVHIDRSSGKPIRKAHWQAAWQSSPGQQKTQRFSINKFGEEKAKKLAIEKRAHAVAALKSGKDPIFVPPKVQSAKLWRYMDFTKFVSMLDNSGIYFCQADLLGDPYEGSYSRGNEKTVISYIAVQKTQTKIWMNW